MKIHRSLVSVMLSLLMVFSIALTSTIPAFADPAVDTTAYEAFVSNLEVLEDYAHDYAQTQNNENETLDVINYIRTGVRKYTTDSWTILAGAENTGFTQYVAAQDAANGTTASDLKDIENFDVPNGDNVDFAHMFGSMDVAYYSTAQGSSAALVRTRADLASWAGDVCDLMLASYRDTEIVSEDIDEYADNIRQKYLGEMLDYAFGLDDIYGDLDAFYILDQLDQTDKRISQILREYFTESLTDEQRAAYFLENRFDGVLSKNDIRLSVYRAYKNNTLLYTLESSRKLQNKHDLRMACCYAFADYLFLLAGDPEAEDTIGDEEEPASDNDFYSVFSTTSSNLAPGIKQDIKYALTKDNKQMVYYLATVDLYRDDVNIYANYNNNDPSSWAMARTTDQMAAIQAKHSNPEDEENYIENYNVIVGTNGDFYNMGNGKPSGALVMNGVTYSEPIDRADRGFFAILKDGTPMIGVYEDWEEVKDDVQEAIGGSVVMIKNGEVVNSNVTDYYGNRAPRTCIGITTEGKIIMMVLDGRQEPFSTGGNIAEIAQIMLDAGCVEAINLDGGGSSTFAAKQEGSDEVTIVNRPSDGYERSVSSSLVVVSTAEPSNKFDHVLIESETDYLTVNSSLALNMNGVSTTGNAADVPADAVYQLSDSTVGHIEDGVFYADKLGEVEVTAVSEGEVIGSKMLYVVKPDRLFFTKTSQDVIYGRTITLPICASYNGNAVTINTDDIIFQLSNNAAGTFSGFDFTAAEDSGLNNITITALLSTDFAVKALISISIYDENAAFFDFENAMYGDRLLAWNREVSNSTTRDNKVYFIEKEGDPMTAEYTFGIDMRSVPMPAQLMDLLYMVAGGDVEGVTAWMFLMQLAERVSPQTLVSVTMNFSPDVEVDISNITVVSDYFILDNTAYDPVENTITLEAHWVKQSAAIAEDTANPVCIVSGIRITPRDTAYWENGNDLIVPVTGKLHYWIGLRSSTLYKMACDPEFQNAYGIYDYDNSANLANDKGGCFEMDYLDFDDTYQLNREIKQGWKDFYGSTYYFVDNEPLTGIQELPSREDPEKKYYYDLGDDGVCKGKINGMFELDGDYYYALNGVLQVSWYPESDENGDIHYYYFDRHTHKAVNGVQTINGYEYEFEDYKLVKGAWIVTENGKQYIWAGVLKNNQWFEVDGKEYFALPGSKGKYIATGITNTLTHDRVDTLPHVFDEDGVWQGDVVGPYDYNGKTYYVDHGIKVVYPGLVKIGDDYYYFKSDDSMVKGQDYYISKTNGLLPQGKYTFAEDGKLELLDGIVKVNDTTWYYYVMGEKVYAGLIEIDGAIYYVRTNGEVVHGQSYYISKTNGLRPEGTYEFDADGKLVETQPDDPDDPPVPLNGIVKETADTWYYYVDDVKTYAGLIEIDGDLYYVRTNCTVVHNQSYFISKTNGILPQGNYNFDEDGKLIVVKPEDKKNGIVKETEDTWYYYVDDIKTYAGLIEIDGAIYYVKTNGEVVHGKKYYITKTNNMLPQDWYFFDEDGKLYTPGEDPQPNVKNGIVKETEDTWYYYVNDVKTYAGLIEIDGDIYYVRTSGEVVHNQRYYITKTNNMLPQDWYFFDEDGKLYTPGEDPQPEVKNGIVKETEDTWYYYVNDVKTYAGLIEIEGDLYYVKTNCTVVHNQSYFISKTNGILPQGTYNFDADGKLIIVKPEDKKNGIVKETEDTWYYYVDDVKTYAGLIEIDGDYYYVNSSFQVIHGRKYFVSKTNGLVPNGDYVFDADGKMVRE